MKTKIIKLKEIQSNKGKLISLEQLVNVPFRIKRVFYIYDINTDTTRGNQAHVCSSEMIICISGKCTISLDNGIYKENVQLDSPNKAIYVGKLVWREIYGISEGCILLVIADSLYEDDKVIRDYSEFKSEVHSNTKR